MTSDVNKRTPLRTWLITFVLCTAGVFASLTTIHWSQSRLADEDARQINSFRQAGDDLDLGILHVALAGEQDSPWQRAQGSALIEQAASALANISGSLDLGESAAALQQEVQRLRAALLTDRSPAAMNDPGLRTVIHAAHTQMRAIELALNARAAARERRLDDAFAWTLGISLVLLTGLATGFVRSVLARERVVRELAARDARLEQTLEAIFDGVVSVDEHGKPTGANPAAQRLLGHDLAQLQQRYREGLSWGAVDAKGAALAPEALPHARVLASGEPVHAVELTVPVPGQTPRLVEVNAVPLREPGSGRLVGVVTSLRDVTVERQAVRVLFDHRQQLEAEVREHTAALSDAMAAQRASDAFVREIADHQDSLVAYYDDTLTLRFANQAFLDWMGVRREDALGRSMAEVLGTERAATRHDSALRVLAGEVIIEPQVEFAAPFGIKGQFRVHRRPDFREGKVRGYYLTAYNVTEIVAARDRLEHLNKALMAERDRAESATRAKSAFLASMSHEIRTPMNAIVGLTALMQRHAAQPEFQDHLEKVSQSAQHLLRLINDILDLSKIEAGELHLEQLPFDPQAMVRRTVDLIAPAARARGLMLDVSLPALPALPASLMGDPTRLSQALLNLLGNGVKFTESGSVRLVVTSLPSPDGEVVLRFEVHDSGIGVDDATLAKLFQPFQQADAGTTRRYGGTGLGLAITREIARRMGGEAGGSGEPGVGSTFWFSARLRPAASKVVEATSLVTDRPLLPRLALRGCRVLLAEDNPINQEVALALLEDVGANVEVASDGEQALALVAQGRFDIVLMDMQMPQMDGLEAARRVRGMPDGASLPIIAMTANAFVEDRQRCLDAGMDDHLAKPVDPEVLYRTMLRWYNVPESASP